VSDEYKLKTYIHIVRLLLEDNDATTAQAYFSRASFLIQKKTTDPLIGITFKVCQARILDANRRFVEASMKYLELSYATLIHSEEKLECLQKAVICAVLADAGTHRSRALATLYKDERIQQLPAMYFSVLEKMYLGRILRDHEVRDFMGTLAGHHVAKLSDGMALS
jgi:COP9 signalosome complex subunit 4